MKSDLRGDAVTHWNLILPQIICIIVVLKVLKLRTECSLVYLSLTHDIFYLLTATAGRSFLPVSVCYLFNESRDITSLHVDTSTASADCLMLQ